jgi:hypothetical protein
MRGLRGTTAASDFPHTTGMPLGKVTPKQTGAFIASISATGDKILYSGTLAGTSVPCAPATACYLTPTTAGLGIAVDAAGNSYVAGNTEFLVGLNATGSKLTYSALYPNGTVERAVAVDPSGLVHVSGYNGFVPAIAPAAPPPISILGFGNVVGNSDITARISPAEIVSIYGPGIGPATAASAAPANGFYPKTFSGVQVQMNGSNIPLLYVSATQINAVVPMGLTSNGPAMVRIINGATMSRDYPVWIVDSAPQAFPGVLNQDGTAKFAVQSGERRLRDHLLRHRLAVELLPARRRPGRSRRTGPMRWHVPGALG